MDEARARDVLAQAGVVDGPGGAGADGAELIALGENAVFAAGDLVVKVGRSSAQAPELLDRARRELAIASYLAEHG
ncbi:aminoglycoside phosphotransferase family protein, partial [Streptomyces sp. SID14478]|nr:aminoglycoside phosphotransferase family protein [Streptomyces sp. SID14478]